MSEPQFELRMILKDPYGKSYSVVMPIDAFEAHDRYIDIKPHSDFDLMGPTTMDAVVERIRKREYRKDDFERAAIRLARKLSERMEDEEGWHGVSRQETYERLRDEGKW